MKIYLDADFKCHVSDDGSMRVVETDLFDRKCEELIEAYRYVPEGESWTREDGEVFHGEMITPWNTDVYLNFVQEEYEEQLLSEYAEALRTVGVEV